MQWRLIKEPHRKFLTLECRRANEKHWIFKDFVVNQDEAEKIIQRFAIEDSKKTEIIKEWL